MSGLREAMMEVSSESLEAMMTGRASSPDTEGWWTRFWTRRSDGAAMQETVQVVYHQARSWAAPKWCWMCCETPLACDGWDHTWAISESGPPSSEEETSHLGGIETAPRQGAFRNIPEEERAQPYWNYFCKDVEVVRATRALADIDLDDGAYPAYLARLAMLVKSSQRS